MILFLELRHFLTTNRQKPRGEERRTLSSKYEYVVHFDLGQDRCSCILAALLADALRPIQTEAIEFVATAKHRHH